MSKPRLVLKQPHGKRISPNKIRFLFFTEGFFQEIPVWLLFKYNYSCFSDLISFFLLFFFKNLLLFVVVNVFRFSWLLTEKLIPGEAASDAASFQPCILTVLLLQRSSPPITPVFLLPDNLPVHPPPQTEGSTSTSRSLVSFSGYFLSVFNSVGGASGT